MKHSFFYDATGKAGYVLPFRITLLKLQAAEGKPPQIYHIWLCVASHSLHMYANEVSNQYRKTCLT